MTISNYLLALAAVADHDVQNSCDSPYSAESTKLMTISNYLLALAAVADHDAGAVNVRPNYSALRSLLPGGGT